MKDPKIGLSKNQNRNQILFILIIAALVCSVIVTTKTINNKPVQEEQEQPAPVPVAYTVVEGTWEAHRGGPSEEIIKTYEELEQQTKECTDLKINQTHVLDYFDEKDFTNHNLIIIRYNSQTHYLSINSATANNGVVAIFVTEHSACEESIRKHESPCYFIFIPKEYEHFILRKSAPAFPYDNVPLDKPIIYLYPTEETLVNVQLGNEEALTCVYPDYNNGWEVLAKPDGNMIDLKTGRSQYCLYYEALGQYSKNNTGFIVKGVDASSFLEEKLHILGLTEREANEFIIYWLPKLEANEYNYIRFATNDEIESNMPLKITPAPDSVIRVFMIFQALETPKDVTEQILHSPERNGFTVVEWGGSELLSN